MRVSHLPARLIFHRCAWRQTGRLQEGLPTKLAANAQIHAADTETRFLLFVEDPSQHAMYGQMERIMGNEQAALHYVKKFYSIARSQCGIPVHYKPDPHPSGSGLCFLMPNLAPYYIIHCYVNESFSGVHLCLSGDDTESAYREEKVSRVL